MAHDIKDPGTDRLARQLADLTGESIIDAVKTAARDRLERERQRRGKGIDWAQLRKAQATIAQVPIVDDRSVDELLDFDESGLPR